MESVLLRFIVKRNKMVWLCDFRSVYFFYLFPFSIMLLMSSAPEAPSAVKALVMSAESILVSWKPPEQPNGIVNQYTVYIREDNDNSKDVGSLFLFQRLKIIMIIIIPDNLKGIFFSFRRNPGVKKFHPFKWVTKLPDWIKKKIRILGHGIYEHWRRTTVEKRDVITRKQRSLAHSIPFWNFPDGRKEFSLIKIFFFFLYSSSENRFVRWFVHCHLSGRC